MSDLTPEQEALWLGKPDAPVSVPEATPAEPAPENGARRLASWMGEQTAKLPAPVGVQPEPAEDASFHRESLGIAWDEGYSAAFHDTGYGDTKNPHQPKEN